MDQKAALIKLKNIDKIAWEIQGKLNEIDDIMTTISGELLHNLQMQICDLEDQLKPKEQTVVRETKSCHCGCEDD